MRQAAGRRQTDAAIKRSRRKPPAPFGKRLRALRQKLIAAGEPLLDWNEIDKEVAERRGES
jgi:hypothetical protein